MASIIPGYEYDIFISYRQKDNKHDGWVTEFVNNLKGELEATFKESVSVYFDENPHDRLQETHHVAKSLEAKLKCVIFIPILSQTYCDPNCYAWQFELVPFNKMAAEDHFGKEIKLRGGNYASRILPIRIHDLDTEDIELFQQETGSVLRAMDFVFKTAQGVNRPLRAHEDHPNDNLNKTFYRDQVNKVARAIKEIILGMKSDTQPAVKEEPRQKIQAERVMEKFNLARKAKTGKISWQKILSGFFIAVALILAGLLIYPKLINGDRMEMLRKKGQVSVAVMPFQNLTRDTNRNFWEVMIQNNLINSLSAERDLSVRQMQSVLTILESHDLTNYASITPAIARSVSQKLDANVFVQGSINQIGEITRLNAQLIDSKTEEVFKSFQLDGSTENIIQLADSLTTLVKDFLMVTMLKKEQSFLDQHYLNIEKTTHDPEALKFYFEGMKAFSKGKFTEARQLYFKAIEIDSNFVAPLRHLPYSYGNEGNYIEAKKWAAILLEKFDQLSPLDVLWAKTTYASYFETPGEEIKYCRQALEIDNQMPIAYYSIGIAYINIHQYDNAIPALEKNLELFKKWGTKPDWAPNYTVLGLAYHKTGQYRKEQRLYKKAEKDFPDNPIIIRRQAILALVSGKTKQADEYLSKFESLIRNEGASEALIQTRLALIYKEAEIPEVAEKYYREALSLEPENPVRQNNLAFFLIDCERDVDQGMELAEKALELRPGNYIYLHTKGLGLYKQGKYPEAMDVLQKSWDLRMERAIYYHEAFLNLEEAKKAVANL
jgi:tetratricopeptide (TPR) repeat protein